MKLTLKIKILPTKEQSELLLETIKEANTACNEISNTAFVKKLFTQFELHKEVYYGIKNSFNLSSQIVIRCISKVSDSYKANRQVKQRFRILGGIAYDSRILSYKHGNISIWTIGGRQKIPFIYQDSKYLPYMKGEADLLFKKDKFYILQTIEFPEDATEEVEEFIGVDFGLTNIAVTSEGVMYSSKWLNQYREKRQKIRSSIQSKGTRSCKKLLKRLSGKERATANLSSHTISKAIVHSAKSQNMGIAIEDLANIHFTNKKISKKFRTRIGNWNFANLRKKIEYKSQLLGVKLVVVNPAYTSKTCHCCHNIGKRTNKIFECLNKDCEVNIIDADYNAAQNIASLGVAINQPEKLGMYCILHST